MRCKQKTSKNVVGKTVTAFLLLFIIFNGTSAVYNGSEIFHAKASSENIAWNATISINELGGASDNVVFGEASDALDGQDDYDMPEPPFPFQLPYIIAKFNTNLINPYNNLWYEYKQYPDDYKVWNLSMEWVPEPGNNSIATITISWNTDEFGTSEYDSILIYQNNSIVADMKTESSYTVNSAGGIAHNYQIVCQSKTSDNNETPFVPIIFILVSIILFTLYYKKRGKMYR